MEYRTWDHDSVFPSFTDPFFPAHLARYFFVSQFLQNKRVFELGCGKGYGSIVLANTAHTVTAVDLNEESISFAKSNYESANLKFVLQDVREVAPELKSSFDAVVSFEVLEHLAPSDVPAFMKTVKDLIKSDGMLFLSTPNHEVVTKSGMPVPDFHINNLKSSELKSLLQQHFKSVEVFGQVENRNSIELFVYYLDVLNLRHSKLAKSFRRERSNGKTDSTLATNQTAWKLTDGPGPASRFKFSKWLWRQAGMSIAVCKGKI